jgi:hypothetical protein
VLFVTGFAGDWHEVAGSGNLLFSVFTACLVYFSLILLPVLIISLFL